MTTRDRLPTPRATGPAGYVHAGLQICGRCSGTGVVNSRICGACGGTGVRRG